MPLACSHYRRPKLQLCHHEIIPSREIRMKVLMRHEPIAFRRYFTRIKGTGRSVTRATKTIVGETAVYYSGLCRGRALRGSRLLRFSAWSHFIGAIVQYEATFRGKP